MVDMQRHVTKQLAHISIQRLTNPDVASIVYC